MKKISAGMAILFLSVQLLSADPFELSLLGDGLALGSGALLSGISLLADTPPMEIFTAYGGSTAQDIFFLDRNMVHPYSAGIDTASDILQYASFLAPAILAVAPVSEWLTIGVMYTEAALFSFSTKETIKNLVARARPYMYYSDTIAPPAEFIESGDYLRSFPSGHTTMAFTGATFASYVFARYFPDSPWRWAVFGTSYAFAISTALTRILSGSHFLSDVLVGAAIGTASGFLVPWLHEAGGAKDDGLSLSAGPAGLSLRIRY